MKILQETTLMPRDTYIDEWIKVVKVKNMQRQYQLIFRMKATPNPAHLSIHAFCT